MSDPKEHPEREIPEDTDRILRPTNALDPLGSPARNPAFSSLMRSEHPSTPERPRFPSFNQLPSRDSPLSELRMPSPYPSSPKSIRSTTPANTPPRSSVTDLLGGLNLESTTPKSSPPSRLQTFLAGSRDSKPGLPAATAPTRPRLPSVVSISRAIHPSTPLSTLGVTRTTAQLRKRGRPGGKEEIERMDRDGNQLDGGSKPRSPAMTATRPPSPFGAFEHEFRSPGRASQPLQNLAFLKATFMPAGETGMESTVGSGVSSQPNPPPPPEGNPETPPVSFGDSRGFQGLNAQQQAYAIDASAWWILQSQ